MGEDHGRLPSMVFINLMAEGLIASFPAASGSSEYSSIRIWLHLSNDSPSSCIIQPDFDWVGWELLPGSCDIYRGGSETITVPLTPHTRYNNPNGPAATARGYWLASNGKTYTTEFDYTKRGSEISISYSLGGSGISMLTASNIILFYVK